MYLGDINILDLLTKTTLVFILMLFLTRILGKKQISHLTYFNYVAGVTVGSIAANMITHASESFIGKIISLVWLCALTILSEYIGLKSGTIRTITDGQPTILIKKGNIIKHSLRVNRLNLDDLSMMLRKQSIFSIKEVEYAVLEPDGSLSVLKKQQQQNITKKDMKIPTTTINYIPSEIITDGKIMKHNLKELNLNEEWLKKQLKQHNISSIKDVFYAEIQSDGTLFIEEN
jgi:uncharacterized membrane protein YcaP (DUF421 family)